jgi:hypothetical protein
VPSTSPPFSAPQVLICLANTFFHSLRVAQVPLVFQVYLSHATTFSPLCFAHTPNKTVVAFQVSKRTVYMCFFFLFFFFFFQYWGLNSASCLLGRCSTTWVTPPALQVYIIFPVALRRRTFFFFKSVSLVLAYNICLARVMTYLMGRWKENLKGNKSEGRFESVLRAGILETVHFYLRFCCLLSILLSKSIYLSEPQFSPLLNGHFRL